MSLYDFRKFRMKENSHHYTGKTTITTVVKKGSMRGAVLSYIVSAPGEETINTITDDLFHGTGVKHNLYRSVLNAVDSLHQRGLVTYGKGPNRSNKKLYAVEGAVDCLV